MDSNECCICLNKIKQTDTIYKLSCDHTFHHQCYLSLVYNNNLNIFFNCPLCRKVNTNNHKIKNNSIDNLKLFCPTKRCLATNKNGKRCQHKSHIFNYDLCYHHNKDILKENKYDLFYDYISWLMEAGNSFKTKIIMIDLGKQILIKYPEIDSIHKIQHFFYKYYYCNGEKKTIEDLNNIYKYYELKPPPDEWLEKCLNNKQLF